MDINLVGIRFGVNISGQSNQGDLSAVVLSSSGASFTVSNLVYNSGTVPFVVDDQVLDSDGNAFTIFT
jgi:hypothetical protein